VWVLTADTDAPESISFEEDLTTPDTEFCAYVPTLRKRRDKKRLLNNFTIGVNLIFGYNFAMTLIFNVVFGLIIG